MTREREGASGRDDLMHLRLGTRCIWMDLDRDGTLSRWVYWDWAIDLDWSWDTLEEIPKHYIF